MGDDMETSNVFDYDWDRDFPDEDTIQSEWVNFSEWNADKLRNGFLPYYYQSDTAFRVQADPQDRLVFAEKVKGRKQYYATKVIWYETIDIIRYFGDGKGRSRSNISVDKAVSTVPRGLCCITGEDTGGSQSSLLRCIVIDVANGTFKRFVFARYECSRLQT